ncbi:Methyltransferase type 11 [Candidatus Magnetomoraceae bacterium gMMP-15]
MKIIDPTEIINYSDMLALSRPLRKAVISSAIKSLQLPLGSHGLDAGCGIGLHTLLLAEAVGPAGHITGLDLSYEFLLQAREFANTSNLLKQTSFLTGDINKLPFENNSFHWIWSVDCAGYSPNETLPLIKELARVVKPGGSIAILGWSSQQLLPGYPQLEARLNATSSGIAPFRINKKPKSHFLRTLGWLRDAGLKQTNAQTFIGDVHAPLTNDMRNALISLIKMRWKNVQSELTEKDWKEYQRISQPESPDFILNLPDYYAFFTYSLFYGKVG